MKSIVGRPLFSVFCIFAFIMVINAVASCDSIGYRKGLVLGIPAHIITADLRDPAVYVTIGLPSSGIGGAESFRSMLRRYQPDAAITGTYFCTKSFKPVGDLVVSGTVINEGSVGTALAIDGSNTARCIPLRLGRDMHWEPFETVLCAGPRLISGGNPCVDPRKEGFHDPTLFRRHIRPAVGLTSEGKLLLVSVAKPVTFSELAKIMRRIGAVDAVGLDGGSSTALYYRGKVILSPKRSLTNLLFVYTDQQMRAQMVKERAKQREEIQIEQAFEKLRDSSAPAEDICSLAPVPSAPIVKDLVAIPNDKSTRPLPAFECAASLPDLSVLRQQCRWFSAADTDPQSVKLPDYFIKSRVSSSLRPSA